MKKSFLFLLTFFLLISSSDAQSLPAKIKKFLDDYYTSPESGAWKQAPGACDGRKWLLTGDFNGDGRTDYLVRFTTGKTARTKSLHLIGFINTKGDYTPDPFFEDEYSGDLLRSASSIIKKGTTVSLGLGSEGEGPSTQLKTDAVTQYICETDASLTFTYKNGEFKNIQDGYITPPDPPVVVPQPTPFVPVPVSQPPVGVPNIAGTYTIYGPDGKAIPQIGTVSYDGTKIVFQISDDRSMARATSYIDKGTIVTGWKRTATVSADGRVINWSDNTKWVRR